jgi:hypothetical protein
METDVSGHEVSVTAFSIEVGHRWTLTVTPQSDGSVAVVRTLSGSGGIAGGTPSAKAAFGPFAFDSSASGTARLRVQAARGGVFPNQATADRFLEHAIVNSAKVWGDFPSDWTSAEGGEELSGMIGRAIGAKGSKDRLSLFGVSASGDVALGGRIARGGIVTLYGRLGLDGEVSVPFIPSPRGHGREEWMTEYTFSREGPRELAFRRVDAGDHGDRSTETVLRLDLRDAENRAIAQPLIDTRWPWPLDMKGRINDVIRRIGTHGTVERTVLAIDDASIGASGSVQGAWKFGAAGRLIRVHKRLVEAKARTGGADRDRFDCAPGVRPR